MILGLGDHFRSWDDMQSNLGVRFRARMISGPEHVFFASP